MNRAMFSGVAGLKAHQTKMDVIGNNISNVNTYGYKSQRAVFSDIMYQTLTNASQGSAARGGVNPSSVGYGSIVSGIQTNMAQSSMQSTSYTTDMSICGDGFFQVMDPAGNIYYTKAGMLDIDANGYLVDMNGNFVLGSTTVDGKPASQKLNLVTSLGAVNAAPSSDTTTVNGLNISMSATNSSDAGNVSFSFQSSTSLPAGEDVRAVISDTGAIAITFNAASKFPSITEVNKSINAAIKEAYGGTHPAGEFNLTLTNDEGTTIDAFTDANGDPIDLTGAEICGTNFGIKSGSIASTGFTDPTPGTGFSGFNVTEVRSGFGKNGTGLDTPASASLTTVKGVAPADEDVTVTIAIGGVTYTGVIPAGSGAGTVLMKNAADDSDAFVIEHPATSAITSGTAAVAGVTAVASAPSNDLGLTSAGLALSGGTEGGAVSLDQLTNIAISSDGRITVTHQDKGTVSVGKISIANFANPAGLIQTGTNYFSETVNSGSPVLCDPGKDGTGNLKSSALEMSNVDLSTEMADMITTQRGFQANSRIITVSDTMLEELINLKR